MTIERDIWHDESGIWGQVGSRLLGPFSDETIAEQAYDEALAEIRPLTPEEIADAEADASGTPEPWERENYPQEPGVRDDNGNLTDGQQDDE